MILQSGGDVMIHYYFGSGKGKTSAAVGACIRAAGNGLRCAAVQFLKNGTSGEIAFLRAYPIPVLCCSFTGTKFFRDMTPSAKKLGINLLIPYDPETLLLGIYPEKTRF